MDSMDIYTKPGQHITYTGKNGREYDRDEANKKLVIGSAYVVKMIDVGDWQSTVTLEGIEGWFNTVMFENTNGIYRAVDIMKEANND